MKRLCRAVRAHTGLACLALLAVLMLSVVLGISLGPVTIPFPEVWRVMLHRLLNPPGPGGLDQPGGHPGQHTEYRLAPPRPGCCWGCWWGLPSPCPGWGCRLSPAIPWRNFPVLGISSGASLGAVLAMLVGGVAAHGAALRPPPAPLWGAGVHPAGVRPVPLRRRRHPRPADPGGGGGLRHVSGLYQLSRLYCPG